ncbi:MAG: APC family permease [Pseudoclavibacter sp.]|nr:APC family permease [Pseudoclavibacter sp.]
MENENNSGRATPKRSGGLGVVAITGMIIAASAPLTVVAGGVPTGFAVTGSLGVPFGYLALAGVLLLFAAGYGAMGRFVRNAGAFYAYIAQGLTRWAGIGSSLVALVAYNAMQIGIFALFGFTISDWLATRFGVETPWWMWVFAGIVVVGALGVNRVDLSARVIVVLVGLEFLAVVVFDVLAFVVAPEGANPAPLTPGAFFAPGIGAVLAFGVAAFMGFESAAIYAEEAERPERTIPRATFLAVGIVGVFYALSSWAVTVGVGAGQVVERSRELGPGLMFAFLAEHTGPVVPDAVQLLFITSLFAALQSFHNAVARYFFSLGREGVLPRWLGSLRREHHAPWAGSLTQTVIAVLVTIGFALASAASDDPLFPVLTMFTWLTTTGAAGLVFLMAVVALAVVGFFRADPRGVSLWSRAVAPALAAVLLLVLFVLIMANFDLLLGQEEPGPLSWVLPGLLVLPGVAGAIRGLVIKRRDPARYEEIGHRIETSPELAELVESGEPAEPEAAR